MKKIGKRIREKRAECGYTQAELARRLGVCYQTVSKWENGTAQPGIDLLPVLADTLETTIDELLGRSSPCRKQVCGSERELLLNHYADVYGPEAGPWNLSVGNKYLEYRFAAFLETNFSLRKDLRVCNIGIGAGTWDRYLAYCIPKGHLTSIDREEVSCRQLELGLALEQNPCDVRVLCADVMTLRTDVQYDLVTVVGSTELESGRGCALLERAMELSASGGALYYQTIGGGLGLQDAAILAERKGMKLTVYEEDSAWGFECRYCKFIKP